MKLTASHKYIKNTSTCGTVLTEYLLNAGRRRWTTKRARKSLCNQVGQKEKEKNKKKGRNWEGTCTPWEGAVKEERCLHPGKSPHCHGDQPGQSGSFRALEENAGTGFAAARTERDLQMVSATTQHSPAGDTHPPVRAGTGC